MRQLLISLSAILTTILTTLTFAVAAENHGSHAPARNRVAKSQVALSAVAVLDLLAELKPELKQELIGVEAKAEQGGILAALFTLSKPAELQTTSFACQIHGSRSHCARSGAIATSAYNPAARNFPLADFKQALNEAVAAFEKTKIEAKSIIGFKAWQSRMGIDVRIVSGSASGPVKTTSLLCHYHGDGIDCHSRSLPGENEPR